MTVSLYIRILDTTLTTCFSSEQHTTLTTTSSANHYSERTDISLWVYSYGHFGVATLGFEKFIRPNDSMSQRETESCNSRAWVKCSRVWHDDTWNPVADVVRNIVCWRGRLSDASLDGADVRRHRPCSWQLSCMRLESEKDGQGLITPWDQTKWDPSLTLISCAYNYRAWCHSL